jgi:septal ring factor EnvC (AmiA/AmiB activator)
MQQPHYAQPFDIQLPAQSPNQPLLQGPNETPMQPTRPSSEHTGQILAGSMTETALPRSAPAPAPATLVPVQSTGAQLESRPGHLAQGMNMIGTELRQPAQTATEIALEMRNQNAELREKLAAMTQKTETLAEEIETQNTALEDSKELLTQSNRLAASLREKIATLNVKVRGLEKAKVMVEINADKALKEIESQLDAMLLSSLSQIRK